MQVRISQAIPMMTAFIKAKLVPMLVGSPGMGKSQIVHQIAKDYNLKMIDLRLSQCDPCDLLGFPHIKGDKAGYVPMDTFPLATDSIPEGYSGWMLFFDEFNAAPPAVQAAAYKVVLDKMVGLFPLHPNVAMVCAGNLETDNAIVQPMSTALQSRLVHMELVVDAKEFIDYATQAGFDHRITDYLGYKPGNVYSFIPDHTDKTYACPRTWEFADRVLKVTEDGSKERLPMLAGTISEGVAREFMGFCKIYESLPKMNVLINSPETATVPKEPSVLFALSGAISHNASKDNFNALMKYIERMPMEFQVVTIRQAIKRNKNTLLYDAVQNWLTKNSAELF